jgi:hypothetical protein
MDTTPNFEQAG